MLCSLDQSDHAFYLSIVQRKSFFKMQQKLNLFSQHAMTLQHHSFRLCSSSIGMYEEFLIVITQLNNVLLDVGCETALEVSNQ
jgi:hypothetical protein